MSGFLHNKLLHFAGKYFNFISCLCTVEELKKDIILKDEKIHRLLGIIRKYEDKYEDSEFGSDISL